MTHGEQTRDIRQPIGIYIFVSRLCYRSWERMEISIYNRSVRRRGIRVDLHILPAVLSFADSCYGVRGRSCVTKKRQSIFRSSCSR